jgi:nucleoside 2-deoxyribosyltransferase
MAILNLSDVGYDIRTESRHLGFGVYEIFRALLPDKPVITLRISPDLENDAAFWEKISDKISVLVFHGIGFNKQWDFNTADQAIKFVNDLLPKISPKDKLYQLLEHFHSLSDFDGDFVDIDLYTTHQQNVWRRQFFNSIAELQFYVDALKEKNWIVLFHDGGPYIRVQLTLTGITEVSNYEESKNSNICFVAMSFDPTLTEIYNNAIQPAIIETGFVPFILHSAHIETGSTINDAMIAAIKKAKFTIADFTQHKDGVYFEAGFALGRGQKVIFTCKEGDIDEAHFDTRNYQHILWKDAADLKRKLIDKIEAYIKD